MFHLTVFESPIGPLTVAAHDDRLIALSFGDERRTMEDMLRRRHGADVAGHPDPAGAASALRAYFAGDLSALDTLSVEPHGTAFQQRVWSALRDVRAGTTASYRDIANAIGAPAATRAVGAANGANPIAIVVPCHRIIGAGGSLVGYGGALERKRWLLEHEWVLLKM